MRARVLVVRGALVAAVVASIATSVIRWSLSADQTVPIQTLTNQVAELHYMIHVQLSGAGPFDGSSGLLTATVTLTPQSPPPADITLHLKLTSLTHPDQPPIEDVNTVAISMSTGNDYIDAQLWDGCAAGPCSEDFELTVSRDPNFDLPPIDVAGTIQVDITGNKSKAPDGTTLTVEVTPLP